MNRLCLFLSIRSMLNRKLSSVLTLSSIAMSVCLLLGVERIREGAREGFEHTIADTDLIVGARSGPIQLLLYSVFHIGNATNNMSWQSYKDLSSHPEVKWAVPVSLGDSHRGFRVVGTNADYFKYYKVGRKKSLKIKAGAIFSDVYEAVIGTDVAKTLSYRINDKITLAHGVSEVSFQKHDDKPFVIKGILAKTGTPVDRAVHIGLDGLEAMHVDWQNGAPPLAHERVSAEAARKMDLTPKDVTAVLLGLRSKIGIFHVQREINNYEDEPLSAVLPGITFRELWDTISIAESALLVMGVFVVIAGILGMLSSLLTTLNERRRELAILRSLGARPADIFLLLLAESLLLAIGACFIGVLLLYLILITAQPLIESHFGLFVPIKMLGYYDAMLLLGVVLVSFVAGCIPALKAYRRSLADGLSIKF